MGKALDAGNTVLKFPGGKQASGKAISSPGLIKWPAIKGSSSATHPGFSSVVSAKEWDRELLDLDDLGTAKTTGLSLRKKPVVAQMKDVVIWCNGIDPVQVYDPTSGNVYDLGIVAPAAAPALADQGTGSFAGEYTYWYRYKRSETGEYSALSAGATHTADESSEYIRVTTVASAESGVDKIEIFRSKIGSLGIYFIKEQADTTLTFDDATADDDIDITLVPPLRPAPGGVATVPVFDYLIPYQGRLWGMVGNKVYWSEPHAPWLVPALNARSLPAVRDEGSGFAVSHDTLYVSQKRHLYRTTINNVTETGQIIPNFELVDDSTGFASQHAVTSVENTIWFVSGEGKIYQTTGSSVAQERAPNLEETLKRLFTKKLDEAVAGYAELERKVYFGVALDESTYNNVALVADLTTGTWTISDIAAESLHEYRDSDGRGRLCFGNPRGDIAQIGVGNGYGARKGTLSGSPTAGTINTLTDSTAAFDADLKGVPVTLFDAYWNVLQTNMVSTLTSTVLTTGFKWDVVPQTGHSYVVGGSFPVWKLGWIDVNFHMVLKHLLIGYKGGRGKGGIYIAKDDGEPELFDSFNFGDTGHKEIYPMLGGKRFQVTLAGFDGASPFELINVSLTIE